MHFLSFNHFHVQNMTDATLCSDKWLTRVNVIFHYGKKKKYVKECERNNGYNAYQNVHPKHK